MAEPGAWELPGWPALVGGDPYATAGSYPVVAYSEWMPGPFVGKKPAGADDPVVRIPDDDHGWRVSAYQEAEHLRVGLAAIGRGVAATIRRLQRGHRALSHDAIADNPYTPPDLVLAGPLLSLRPLYGLLATSLSRTQDDMGRVRWTLFGASEQGPAAAFWCSFLDGPGRWSADGPARLHDLLASLAPAAGRVSDPDPVRALQRSGVRVLPIGDVPEHPAWADEPLPPWIAPLVIDHEHHDPRGVHLIVTFRAFSRLPPPIRAAYLAGLVELCPSPHTLCFFGHQGYLKLAGELAFATQIPLLRTFSADRAVRAGLRVPQSGWLDESDGRPHLPHLLPSRHGPVVDKVERTHRWERVRRDQEAGPHWEDKVSDALFSTAPETLELYGKPMARNAQIWTEQYRLLLDGAGAGKEEIDRAARALAGGGRFGYRFHWPPMRVRTCDVYWQRPIAFADHDGPLPGQSGGLTVDVEAARGWLVAYQHDRPVAALWPRADDRAHHRDNVAAFATADVREVRQDVRKLLEVRELLAAPLDRTLAACLVSAKQPSIDSWLAALPDRAVPGERAAGERVVAAIAAELVDADPGPARTFDRTATRATEERYWNTIATLATGEWHSKNNADPADTAHHPAHADVRDLDRLAAWLADQYARAFAHHGVAGAVVGEHRFRWSTDFDYPWMKGWRKNQTEGPLERNVIAVIPGRDRTRAVILADHYDTAYMEDIYDGRVGGKRGAGTRLAAAGADDNHSATAALLLAADIFLPMAKAGQLAHDVWLVHLTGEEFPGDCLGARHLVQRLIERNLAIELVGGGRHDLSGVTAVGTFVMDMIAHNLERDRYVFQISPGEGVASTRLAAIVQRVNQRWNRATAGWNRHPARRDAPPYQRRAEGTEPPAIAPHPIMHGEVRLPWHWSSTVFNTDAQIWNDAGLPVVLLMEHYDIDRSGYHDTLDNLANIDLDFGAAVMAIAIETVAEIVAGGEAGRAGRAGGGREE